MTIDIKLTQAFTDSTLPVMPHGTGVTVGSGETPYRWVAEDLAGSSGTQVASWPETAGNGTLTGSSTAATLANVSGYKSVAFDGSGALSIPASAPLASSRGTICGVARLSPSASGSSRYGLLAFSHVSQSPSSNDGKITRETDGKMLFDRLGTTDVTAKSATNVNPGDFFTFGFSQSTSGAFAMLNGTTFSVGAGDIQAFQRFFIGTIGASINWTGDVFEIAAWQAQLSASHFTQFHNAMKNYYTFIS